jgi:hypothetical protein
MSSERRVGLAAVSSERYQVNLMKAVFHVKGKALFNENRSESSSYLTEGED